MDWIYKVILVVCVSLIAGLFSVAILIIINSVVENQCDLTNKRKEKYLKNKEKQIIEQLEFEKGIYVRKVKIEKGIYIYVFYTRVYAWAGKIYPQVFETLDKLVECIKKLEKKEKI